MSPDRPRLTFAVPFYDDVELLHAALVSLLAQSRPDWEAVVVDNAPRDVGAGRAVAAIGDPRIRCARNPESLPIGANWNRCLDLAGSELVTLLHSDDLLLPGYAARMLEAADRVPEAAAYFCRADPVDRSGHAVRSAAALFKRWIAPRPDPATGRVMLRGEPAVRALLRGNFIVCPTLCYRRARIGSHRFSERWRFVLDLDFTVGLLLAGETLVGLPERGLAYRLHAGSQTSQLNRTLDRFREEAAFLAEAAAPLEARGWRRAAAVARRRGVTKLHLAFQAAADLVRLHPRRAAPKLELLGRLLAGRESGA